MELSLKMRMYALQFVAKYGYEVLQSPSFVKIPDIPNLLSKTNIYIAEESPDFQFGLTNSVIPCLKGYLGRESGKVVSFCPCFGMKDYIKFMHR